MTAASLLPPQLRQAAMSLPRELLATTEEIRLRAGYRPTLLSGSLEHEFSELTINSGILGAFLESATRGSVHSVLESIRQGFVTVASGHRLGICGSVVIKDGRLQSFGSVSSLTLRIARQIKGAASGLVPQICCNGNILDTLIVSPPGCGKTTLLRDLTRQLSNRGYRVSIADERCEIAAMSNGVPSLDIGRHSDVIDSCPKATAMMMLLRAHNPQVLVTDEITAPEDLEAVKTAAHCGVSVIATVHARGIEDLARRKLYYGLSSFFEKLVWISSTGGKRIYRVEDFCEESGL